MRLGSSRKKKIPKKLSKGVSTISLTGQDKKGTSVQEDKVLLDMLDVYESAIGDPNSKVVAQIARFPSVQEDKVLNDIAYSSIDFPSLENRLKKNGIFGRLWR